MKKLLFILCMVFSLSTFAKNIPESEVPAEVKNYVTQHYKEAKAIDWDKTKNNFGAIFYIEGREIKLEIDATGNLVRSIEVLEAKAIPAFIRTKVGEEFPDTEIMNVRKMTGTRGVGYRVELATENADGSTKERTIIFDDKGNITKK